MSAAKMSLIVGILLGGVAGCKSRFDQPAVKHEATANANGVITVDILEGGSPETYWHYTVRPADGTVNKVSEQRFANQRQESIPQKFAQPAGAITTCRDHPTAESPDGRLVATCIEVIHKTGEFSVSYSYSFLVSDASHLQLLRWDPSEWRNIRGFAWSPDSKSVAVLNLGEYYGKGPSEILSGMAGHPVPHNTVYLDLFETDGWKRKEYMVRNEVISAFTRILSWQ